MANEASCLRCVNAVFQDEGYSNYTVENTSFGCLRERHPSGIFDRWYGKDDRFDYAAQCSSFEAGDPIEMDVDHETVSELTPEQKVRWTIWCNLSA